MTTRQRKTPQQRAQERLDTQTRITDRLNAKVGAMQSELYALVVERDEAVRRREFYAADPDLRPDEPDEPLPDPEDD